MSSIDRSFTIIENQVGERFDKVLAQVWSDYSRSKIQQWIGAGGVTVNGQSLRPKQKAKLGDHCVLSVELEAVYEWCAEPIPLQVIYEDKGIIVLNKPDNLVVHPAVGHWSGTLVNGLLHRYPELESLPRAGIVHRLDKDTTGVMVVARTLEAHHALIKSMQARDINREYQALVYGDVAQQQFSVDSPIGRHPKNRLKMATVAGAKPAKTHFRIREQFEKFVLLDVKLETGRTHQIRVHLAKLGLPIFGDQLYGNKQGQTQGFALQRQALHAWRLRLMHPLSGQVMVFEARLPPDFQALLEQLRCSIESSTRHSTQE